MVLWRAVPGRCRGSRRPSSEASLRGWLCERLILGQLLRRGLGSYLGAPGSLVGDVRDLRTRGRGILDDHQQRTAQWFTWGRPRLSHGRGFRSAELAVVAGGA